MLSTYNNGVTKEGTARPAQRPAQRPAPRAASRTSSRTAPRAASGISPTPRRQVRPKSLDNSGTNLKIRRVTCPHCGGSVNLSGGFHVKTVVCNYCNSVLDLKDDLKIIIENNNRLIKPHSDLRLGDKGKLRGVRYTVIGIAVYEQREDGEIFRWIEYLMFSPTHGYVYLVEENGHWVLMHEVKDLPDSKVDFTTPVRSIFTVRDKQFTIFEVCQAKVVYAVGEFTWLMEVGSTVTSLDAICPPYQYSIERQGTEMEYFLGEYIDHTEIAECFHKQDLPTPEGIAPCQAQKFGKEITGISYMSLLAAVLTFILYLFISSDGTSILNEKFSKSQINEGSTTREFQAEKNKTYAVKMSMSGLSNSWAYLDGKVISKDEQTQFCQFGGEMSYYSGYDDERWVEDYSSAICYFKAPEDGTYKVAFECEGGHGESSSPDETVSCSSLNLSIKKGACSGDYTKWLAILFAVLSALLFFIHSNYETARWHTGDDDDDDDDDDD